MDDRRSFLKGVITGIFLVIALNTFARSANMLYTHFVKNEMTFKEKYNRIESLIDKYHVNEYTDEMKNEGLYSGLVLGLNDRYSYYMNSEQFANFMDDTNGTYVGIGVIIGNTNNQMKVLSVFEGSPSESAGIEVGDIIRKINGFEINDDTFNQAVELLKKKDTTSVELTIFRESQKKEFNLIVEKNSVDLPTVSHRMLDNSVGYIMISKFDGVTYNQFEKALNELESEGMERLIIDLRDNPGGLLNITVKITDLLVPKGYITYTEDKYGKKEYQYSDDKCLGKPLAILVNGGSASASEVLSGAVKGMKAGVLVGTQTFGKGVVQNIFSLKDGSGVKLTVAKYYTPDGICIDGKGLEPDYTVELPEDYDANTASDEADTQLQKAIEVLEAMPLNN